MPALRYRLPAGDRFVIDARLDERIELDGLAVADVGVRLALRCRVVSASGDVAHVEAAIEDVRLEGSVFGRPPPVEPDRLRGPLRVRKRLDGRIESVEGGEPLERMLGGLTTANVLRWLGASFPADARASWSARDRWILRSDLSPLGVRLPLRPVVDVDYRYRRTAPAVARNVELELAIGFSGGCHSSELGLDVVVSGDGSGRVRFDAQAGKLVSSEREATLDIVPRAVRRGALALPPLVARRRAWAGIRVTDAAAAASPDGSRTPGPRTTSRSAGPS